MKFYLGVYLLLTALVIQVSCQCGIARVDQSSTQSGRFPWHVLIYQRKSTGFYDQVCAGTLISSTVVISAAHCFFDDDTRTKLDASSFIVAAGKRFLAYNQPDEFTQISVVDTINLPTKYYGSVGKYMNDIAWLILKNPFDITTTSVGVICMDFENVYESEELRPGKVGKAVGRSDSAADSSSNEIQETNVSFVSYRDCISKIQRDSDVALLYDKFCGVYLDGPSICSRDAGGGLVFYHSGRWYLRGIIGVSIAFQGDCSTSDPILFTNFRRYIEETKANIAVKVVEVQSSSEGNDDKPVTQAPNPPEENFECGVTTVPNADLLIANGFDAGVGGFPWHTGVYRKNATGYFEQICAGSLVSETVVISAAHCFYDDRLKRRMNANQFAIAVGKHYRPYNWLERFAQKSLVDTIHLSKRYLGADGLYAGDIAYIILKERIILTAFVKPICLEINSQQTEKLLIGQVGKAAGWGLTEDGSESHTLQQMNVPFVPYRECVSKLPQDYKPYVTIDKFCAGYLNGTMLCSGDSGGGLVFQRNGRWYLRGIVSVNPRGGVKCEENFYTAFTDVGLFGDELYKHVDITYN